MHSRSIVVVFGQEEVIEAEMCLRYQRAVNSSFTQYKSYAELSKSFGDAKNPPQEEGVRAD